VFIYNRLHIIYYTFFRKEMDMLNWQNIISLRMQRLHITAPVGEEQYDRLFTDMSPVPTLYWTVPGSPPTLPGHVSFNDYEYNLDRRTCRGILKGRFAGGCIAYVTEEDLEAFACLYRKEVSHYSYIQEELLELLRQEGPMNIKQMKELTGLKVKVITAELHKLQEAFTVYEDQVDNEWDRGWYLFEAEFPELDIRRYTKKEALKRVLPRVAALLVFFSEGMLKSYYRLPVSLIHETVEEYMSEGLFISYEADNQKGYIMKEDREILLANDFQLPEPKIVLLQKNDFLVRAYADELKARFRSEWDSLYYILVDGVIHGAVVGKFKFGPHVIEDVILDLPESEKRDHHAEIVKAVYEVFDREKSPIRRYDGKEGTIL
jgi:hypothetical protein